MLANFDHLLDLYYVQNTLLKVDYVGVITVLTTAKKKNINLNISNHINM